MTEAEKAAETEKAYVHWLYKAAGAGSRGLLKKLERAWTAQEIYRMAREGVLADKLAETGRADPGGGRQP